MAIANAKHLRPWKAAFGGTLTELCRHSGVVSPTDLALGAQSKLIAEAAEIAALRCPGTAKGDNWKATSAAILAVMLKVSDVEDLRDAYQNIAARFAKGAGKAAALLGANK
jgi:hypothetical protein